jgi:O-antigen/teichoic acid export membrane protein
MADTSNSPLKRRRPQADTLAASVIILLAVTVVQRSVGFGRSVLFCRWMSPEALGEWEMAFSFLMLAAPLAVLGVPGSFGRYAEHYRQRGHLRTFLRRTAGWTLGWTVDAVALAVWMAPQLSRFVFGSDQYAAVMRLMAVCLAAVILNHTLTALLTALRLYRIVSAMSFAQSLSFAALSLALLWRRPEMVSVLYGYAAACLLASVGAMAWAWPALVEREAPIESLRHSQFWGKLLRLAFFVWATNLLTHLFAVVDRYMLVHYAGMTPEEALDQIGQYHASRIVPLLMVSVAELLAGLVMPHLSSDWEAGRREAVSRRLNLAFKLTSLALLAFGACVLAAGPVLFNVILEGRFVLGLTVLPWAVAGCVWYSLYLVAQNYLWCAEKNWLQCLPLALGLAANVLLNLALLPGYGLYGCALAAAVAAGVCLISVIALNGRHGMYVERGSWLMALAPAALGLGAAPAAVACALAIAVCLRSEAILTSAERRQLLSLADGVLQRAVPWLRRMRAAARG